MARSTAESYLALLQAVFLVHTLPAYGTTLNARMTRRPKVYVLDSGIAGRSLGLDPGRVMGTDPTVQQQFGHVLETFVVGEVLKQVGVAPDPPGVYHYRDHEGRECDVVLQRRDGAVVVIEVKASGRVRSQDLRSLAYLRDKLGTRFRQGIVLTLGQQAYRTAEDRIVVAPVDRLWH